MKFREVQGVQELSFLGRPAGRIPSMQNDTLLRVAGFTEGSIADGPGIRLVLFTQGCPHHCPGCHNPATHDPAGGRWISLGEISEIYEKNPLYAGITLSGGEPLLQAAALLPLARHIKERGGTVVLYTGYTLEKLQAKNDKDINDILRVIDLLIDGPYIEERRNAALSYRGSENQRLLLSVS